MAKGPSRYYFQWDNGWYVFDRQCLDKQGGALPIAQVWERDLARKIRDWLNEEERMKDQ